MNWRDIAAMKFPRFAMVGGLGTLVNMACLWGIVQWVFGGDLRGSNLLLAQLGAIAVATIHNFLLNRWWTWRDRADPSRDWRSDFLRYVVVAALSISLQLLCVALLKTYVHYLVAAGFGIVMASAGAFVLNDRWSFKATRATTEPALMSWREVLRTGAAAMVAVCAYLYAVDSSLIPKNGDENVYLHIARVTGSSAKIPGVVTANGWLPLQSELNDMRNTKPPLLFFQARVAAQLSEKWSIAVLRMPSLIYTFATAGLIVAAALAMRIGLSTAILAAALWLAFFSTFRYGRPYLTTAPEVFWLFSALLTVMRWPLSGIASPRAASQASAGAWLVVVTGLLVGVGLLHKSFALALPVGLGLGLILLIRLRFQEHVGFGRALGLSAAVTGLSCTLALALFGLWFVFDPDPHAVWREFVVGENVGKMGGDQQSWVSGFMGGSSSVWAYLLACLINPGALFLVAAAGLLVAARNGSAEVGRSWFARLAAQPVQLMLWAWLLAWVLVFALPSQRSGRYILPAMPVVAILVALHWDRISAWVLRLNHVILLAVFAIGAVVAGSVRGVIDPLEQFDWLNLSVGAAGFVLCIWGVWRPKAWPLSLPVACWLAYLSFATAFRPLDGMIFSPLAAKRLAGQTVAVPCNFRAKFEEFQFVFPQSTIVGYHDRLNVRPTQLAAHHSAFVVRTQVGATAPYCVECDVMGSRFVFRSRHTSDEIRAMLRGELADNLLAREWLIRAGPQVRLSTPDPRWVAAMSDPENRCL